CASVGIDERQVNPEGSSPFQSNSQSLNSLENLRVLRKGLGRALLSPEILQILLNQRFNAGRLALLFVFAFQQFRLEQQPLAPRLLLAPGSQRTTVLAAVVLEVCVPGGATLKNADDF